MIPRDSAVPAIDVDTAALMAEATALTGHARSMHDRAEAMKNTWSTLPAVFEMDGTEAIYSKLDRPVDVVDEYVGAFESAAVALESFAITIAELQRQRDELLTDLDGARILEQNAEDNPDDLTLAVTDDDTDALRTRITSLLTSFEQAEDECAATLRGINGGTGDGLSAAPRAFMLYGATPHWQSQAAAYSSAMSDGALRTMSYLATLSESDAEKWVSDHPDFVEVMTTAPPPPEVVAQWWKAMDSGTVDPNGIPVSSPQQAALISALPAVIGNLGGVTFSSRNEANQLALTEETARLNTVREQYVALDEPSTSEASLALLAKNGFSTKWELEEAIGAAASIQLTLEATRDGAPRTLVAYTTGSPPLAAVAVGDPDTASQVTTNVPGMNTSVSASMEEWTAAAEQLYREQTYQLDMVTNESSAAVIAWIGYETPHDLSVLGSDRAKAGADKLVDFLESTAATRGTPPGKDLSLVLHSYGSTTGTIAASRTPVENVTMLAPAGLDGSVSHVSDLQVDPTRVWATEADQDWTANMGRGDIEIGNLNLFDVYSEHTHDPTSSEYGSNIFSSEDAFINTTADANASPQQLHGTGGHGIATREKALMDGENPDEYGYLDQGSTSLFNTARTSLGYGQGVREADPWSEKIFGGPVPGGSSTPDTGDDR
jgi:hypothetical protein